MKTVKYELKVSAEGDIKIPRTPSLTNREVDIIIIPKTERRSKKNAATKFVKKWGGIIENKNVDNSKLDYLSDKYK